jgi:hypothetical protein
MKYLLIILFLPLSVFAQSYSDASFALFWDAAKTDTQAAIHGTDSLVSQPFRAKAGMSLQVFVQEGDTANASLDSSKVRIYMQYTNVTISPPPDSCFNYTVGNIDSIGLDSTFWDRSSGGSYGQRVCDISTITPVTWCRAIAKGLSTNSKAANDSTKFSVDILRYNP